MTSVMTRCVRGTCRQHRRAARRPPLSLLLAPPPSHSARGTSSSTAQARFRMAVVGSGPAGFYAAYRVMSRLPHAEVDMYEALPVPFGLVRFGVAPDHPEVKNCQDKFRQVASSPGFTFVGNVAVGRPASHPDGCSVALGTLLRHYHAVVFAYGATEDRTLGIPGEAELAGIYSARHFVGWYNGLPEHAGLAPDLTRGDEAVIIGQGNVALDLARMLLENVDVLRRSDMTETALETLHGSRIRRVHVVGRRGPLQAAYTIKELRELMRLRSVAFHKVDMALPPDAISALPRPQRRLIELLLKGSTARVEDGNAARSWSLDFCLAPTAFEGAPGGETAAGDPAGRHLVHRALFHRTHLARPADPASAVTATGDRVVLPCSVVFRSIGYRSSSLPGFTEAGIGFDDRNGIIRNDGLGRVCGPGPGRGQEADPTTRPLPGLYCAGWVKRGPTGVIASTMEDAFATGDAVAADWLAGADFLLPSGQTAHGWDGVRAEIRGGHGGGGGDSNNKNNNDDDNNNSNCGPVVTWQDWDRIDAAERERGRAAGKEREKFTSTAEMLRLVA